MGPYVPHAKKKAQRGNDKGSSNGNQKVGPQAFIKARMPRTPSLKKGKQPVEAGLL